MGTFDLSPSAAARSITISEVRPGPRWPAWPHAVRTVMDEPMRWVAVSHLLLLLARVRLPVLQASDAGPADYIPHR